MSAETTDRAPPRVVLSVEYVVAHGDPEDVPTLLARASGLSKLRIKDAQQKGAVWLAHAGRKPARLRRAKTRLTPGDRLELHYDSAVLALVPPPATLVEDARRYSVWHKPAGLLVEGSRFGDHATLASQVANHFTPRREVYLVHRLDLEASGLLLIAHSRTAAARLSALFQARAVDKRYRVEVLGKPGAAGECGRIELPLDGKHAVTAYRVESVDEASGRSVVQVRMLSGRYHQIRRHFEAIGHPVIGDPAHGRGNKDPDGLRLAAIGMAFEDPWSRRPVRFGEVTEWPQPTHSTPAT